MADLQSGVTVTGNAITGTLLYVTGYTGFSGDVEEQSGNYLALHITAQAGDAITIQLVDNGRDPVTLDADGLCVIRITDLSYKLRVTATAQDGSSEARDYDLSGLTLNEE